MPIVSLHHVTATVGDAQEDLDFCLRGLGLRLVKKTVNFDNHHVYHFYYGDERGTPGTIWTTFPYKGRGVREGTKGAGQVTATSFSVPAGSLDDWRTRLRAQGIESAAVGRRFGEDVVRCSDPSGLDFELVGTDRDDRAPWTSGGAGERLAIRGLHSVTCVVREPGPTVDLMTRMLGYAIVNEVGGRIRLAVNGDVPGHVIDIVHDARAESMVNGLGTVHHVAMAITGEHEQLQLREQLLQYGCRVTEVRDRCYFKSIYFREPGGVLFEVATTAPGFEADEPRSELGRALKLPPWEEGNRADIEASLAPVEY
jgi:glyoxalase family protein